LKKFKHGKYEVVNFLSGVLVVGMQYLREHLGFVLRIS